MDGQELLEPFGAPAGEVRSGDRFGKFVGEPHLKTVEAQELGLGVVGGEGSGLSSALVAASDQRASIPMRSPVESLNAAVAVAIIVYEARRQRG